MPLLLIPLVAIYIFFQVMVSADTTTDGRLRSDNTSLATLGQSMLALHTYAAAYAQSNPAFTGTPSPTTVGAPSWYVLPSSVSIYIAGGKSYVYYTGSMQGLASYMNVTTQNPYEAGTNLNGVLSSPNATAAVTAPMTIPAAVPSGSVVVMP